MPHIYKGETCVVFSAFNTMSSVKSAIEQAFPSTITETEKVKALKAFTFDATSSDQVLTSDHGVKMSDTDNW